MKKFFNKFMVVTAFVLALFASSNVAMAQSSDEPIITFKTNIYDSFGAVNQFSLVLGAITEDSEYFDIDFGFGKNEYEVTLAADNESGTLVSGTVSSAGIVKIYGDASKLDYFNASGCYIEWIEFNGCVAMDILDLSHNELKRINLGNMPALRALNLKDNAFSAESPLVLNQKWEQLQVLELDQIDYMDMSTFDMGNYPELISFTAYHNLSLNKIEPGKCPKLAQLSLDVTNVETLDVTKNPELAILNISETRVSSIDVSKNPKLRELYCVHQGSYNNEYKLTSLDITNNPELVYLFCAGNKLTSLDISKCPKLVILAATDNYFTSFDVSNNPNLYQVYLNKNCMDFATLPINPGTWNTYYYSQRNFPVEKSYIEGTEFDFSSRVLRAGTTTKAYVFSVSEATGAETQLDASAYTYSNGKLKFNTIPSDSVYVAFINDVLNEAVLRTDNFKIKSAAEFGKPTKALSFATAVSQGEELTFELMLSSLKGETEVEYFIDLGNQVQKSFKAKTNEKVTIKEVKPGYGQVVVYVPENVYVTGFYTKGVELYSLDVTPSASLRELHVVSAGLHNIDLSYNRCLESLDLSDNNLSMLSLEGVNGNYQKYMLTKINLSKNSLYDLTLNDQKTLNYLDLSNNQLTNINFADADFLIELNIANNKFTELNFLNCKSLKRLDYSNNQVSYIIPPTESTLEYVNCSNNQYTLATLPERGTVSEENYVYAPQADFQISTKGPGADLSSQNRDGATTYVWKKVTGEVLTDGVDYKNENGVTTFLNTTVGKVYCEKSNAKFPDFTGENVYKTTAIEVAGAPTNLIAKFKTINEGDSVSLSLAAAKEGVSIYFDWNGDNTMTQYLLGETYRTFTAATKAGKEVKVYTYEPTEAITIFSMGGAKLEYFDGSKLTDAINITVTGAGLSDITLPEGSRNLAELSIESNEFTSFDLSKYPELRTVYLSDNKFTTLDLTKNAKLEVVAAVANELTEVKLDNERLWELSLDSNNLTEIDLSKVPAMRQLSVSRNKLESIEVEHLKNLVMLVINNNNFTFKTLPLHKPSYAVYYYHNQYPIIISPTNGIVDLSDQLMVDGTETVYRWFIDVPVVNPETGVLEGEEMIVDTEYKISGGVTKFMVTMDDVMCVMTNEKLPNVWIYTSLMDVVETSGLEEIAEGSEVSVTTSGNDIIVKSSEAGYTVNVVGLNGTVVRTAKTEVGETVLENVASGVYLVTVGNKVAKVAVK